MKRGLFKSVNFIFKEEIGYSDPKNFDYRNSNFILLKRNNLGDALCIANGGEFVYIDSIDYTKMEVNEEEIRLDIDGLIDKLDVFHRLLIKVNATVTKYPGKYTTICDECSYLLINEEGQKILKNIGIEVYHTCKKSGQRLTHDGDTPTLSNSNCPLKSNIMGGLKKYGEMDLGSI